MELVHPCRDVCNLTYYGKGENKMGEEEEMGYEVKKNKDCMQLTTCLLFIIIKLEPYPETWKGDAICAHYTAGNANI